MRLLEKKVGGPKLFT